MWNEPSLEQLSKMPKPKEQDGLHTSDVIIHAHFFLGDCDWYVSEFDGKDEFFGFVILNGDYEMAEWGYFRFSELKDLKKKINWTKVIDFFEVDYDMYWKPIKVKEIYRIVEAGGSW
jgi:hypothetical protein